MDPQNSFAALKEPSLKTQTVLVQDTLNNICEL